MLPLHAELQSISKDNPAGYIKTSSFAYLTINRLLEAAHQLKGKNIAAGSGALSAALVDLAWNTSPNIIIDTTTTSAFPDRELDIVVTSSFKINVKILITGDESKIISTLSVVISNARVHVRAENNSIIIEGSEFDAQRRITREIDADNLLALAGIDPIEAAYVEGHIGYGVVSQAVAANLSQRTEIALSKVFPAIYFGQSIKLVILEGGESLGVIPTETVTISKSSRCECVEGPDYGLSESTITDTSPANPGPNDEIGRVTIGGPIPESKDPLVDLGPRMGPARGVAGLYIPHAFAKKMVVETMPAVVITASDNGTIGFKATAAVGFKNFKVDFDLGGGGILLGIDLEISINAYCDFELFKGVRLPIGWAIVTHASGSAASLQIGFYPSIDNSGAVKLKSILQKADMGKYVAIVIGVGTALKLLGVTNWIGFLLDVVLSAILSNGLPRALRREISNYVGQKEWKLIDGYTVVDPRAKLYPSAPFDVEPSSLLASFEYRG